MGESLAGAAVNGSQQTQALQGAGPWSDLNYRNGSDIDSDNAYEARRSQEWIAQDDAILARKASFSEDAARRARAQGTMTDRLLASIGSGGGAAAARTVLAGDYKGSLERIARSELGAGAGQRDINNYVGQLFEVNNISNAREIAPDRVITLPDGSTPAASRGLALYGKDIVIGEQLRAAAIARQANFAFVDAGSMPGSFTAGSGFSSFAEASAADAARQAEINEMYRHPVLPIDPTQVQVPRGPAWSDSPTRSWMDDASGWGKSIVNLPANTLEGFFRAFGPTDLSFAKMDVSADERRGYVVGNYATAVATVGVPALRTGLTIASDAALESVFARPIRFGPEGVSPNAFQLGETVSVYRKMSSVEASATLETMQLQPPISGTNSSKYLSESLAKVQNFQNRQALWVDQSTVEFVLGKSGYDELMSSSVNQLGSRGVDAIKYNFEGIFDGKLRNIGVPPTKLDEFNGLIYDLSLVSGR